MSIPDEQDEKGDAGGQLTWSPWQRRVSSASSMSELSSLHEGDSDFRQSYRHVQRKALPAISDHDGPLDDLRTASTSQTRRSTRHPHRGNREDDPQSRYLGTPKGREGLRVCTPVI